MIFLVLRVNTRKTWKVSTGSLVVEGLLMMFFSCSFTILIFICAAVFLMLYSVDKEEGVTSNRNDSFQARFTKSLIQAKDSQVLLSSLLLYTYNVIWYNIPLTLYTHREVSRVFIDIVYVCTSRMASWCRSQLFSEESIKHRIDSLSSEGYSAQRSILITFAYSFRWQKSFE